MILARNGIGLVMQARGEYANAERHYSEALVIAEAKNIRGLEALLWLSLGDLAFDQNAIEDAERKYRRGLAISTIVDQPSYVAYALSGLAGIERLHGHFGEAGRLLAEARECLGDQQRYDVAVWSLRKAHLLIDENKPGPALRELEPTVQALRDGSALIDLARGLLLRAEANYLAYGLEAAFGDLAELMATVQVIGTSQFLAPYCRRMPRLLRALASSQHGMAYAAIIGLGTEAPASASNGKVTPIAAVDDPFPDLLNERELQVVMGLCEGLNRAELAARIGRSKSTVDKLIHTIYTATGFEATHQIVAWAYRIGLVSPPGRHG
jgi:ATP/maltotriose-dependent transcriptional regulator MalT